jgi:iron complex outermembrane receptor protein
MTVFLAADYNYRSDTTAIIAGSATYDIDAYGLLDLRLGVRGENDKWSAYAWGKNVTDEYYWNNVSVVFDTITRYAGRPANYGLTFSYNF